MKKSFALTIFLLIIFMTSSVFATNVTMEIVEDNICTIELNDSTSFEKKIVNSNLTNHQVTLQLQINNNAEVIIPEGELMLVIDSSSSMDTVVSGTTTRKDVVLQSANTLVEDLLKANSTSLKIGVVTFSTGNEIDPETGFLITGTEADAQKVCDFTNDLSTLQTNISAIKGVGQYTNLDAGLKLAKQSFTSEDNNKYIIVLTDGLPNLAVGHNDLVSYNGLTNVINETKTTLTSLSGINVITMLAGIDNEDATFREEGENSYTYGQVIHDVFGTETNPTIGKFYNVDDDEIENTITNDIYRDLLPVAKTLEDITVIDYFPQYIVDNFEMTYVDGIDVSNVSSEIDTENNSITWTIGSLEPGQSATILYNLTLKENFNEEIIDQILDTNEKVDVNYKDYDQSIKSKTSEITPKIKLTSEEPIPPVDDTISPDPLPAAGLHLFIFAGIVLVGFTIFFGYKARKVK